MNSVYIRKTLLVKELAKNNILYLCLIAICITCVPCSSGYLGVQIPALMDQIIQILLVKEARCECFFF